MILTVLIALFASYCHSADWSSQAILYLDNSPQAKLHPVPVRAVKLTDGFWKARQTVTIEKSLPTLLALLEEHGVIDNFRRISGRKKVDRKGPLYTDSDLYKWMEAAGWALHTGEYPQLRADIDRITDEIAAAQEPSGYLNTYFIEDRVKDRFQRMQTGHELYCLGHLLQAGIAYYRATGGRRLLDIGVKFVDYLERDFGPDKKPLLTGHPELELALVELYRTTGERKHLELARYLLSGVERERLKLKDSEVKYMFSGSPFTSRKQLEGHAVRAMYACTGAADYYLETGDPAYRATLDTLWQDMTGGKLYLTGGVGSRAAGEAFGEPYELPNFQAYTESCAAIANFIFNQRMLAMTAEARYADVMERALYNGINSGMSLDGTLYCYRNPLASLGEKIRNPWYNTTCCPPNIQRTILALSGYFFSTNKDGLWAHFYDNAEMNWKLESGTALRVTMKGEMPWKGKSVLTIDPAKPEAFTLNLRVPAWSRNTRVTVNGQVVTASAKANAYFPIKRTWNKGDRVSIEFDIRPRLVEANARVPEDYGKVAVQRGAMIYCLEQPDHKTGNVLNVALRAPVAFTSEWKPEMLGGVMTLKTRGVAFGEQPLYRYRDEATASPLRPADLTLIPYYAWANRGESAMTVWLPLR
ncbi:MAG: glycoside hydrolase family 127 protein [Acidobacteria bacterium]|nr:glycoside hydrolase family 127 protein [Acidobacteriota bacterium]